MQKGSTRTVLQVTVEFSEEEYKLLLGASSDITDVATLIHDVVLSRLRRKQRRTKGGQSDE